MSFSSPQTIWQKMVWISFGCHTQSCDSPMIYYKYDFLNCFRSYFIGTKVTVHSIFKSKNKWSKQRQKIFHNKVSVSLCVPKYSRTSTINCVHESKFWVLLYVNAIETKKKGHSTNCRTLIFSFSKENDHTGQIEEKDLLV